MSYWIIKLKRIVHWSRVRYVQISNRIFKTVICCLREIRLKRFVNSWVGVVFDLRQSTILHLSPSQNPLYYTSLSPKFKRVSLNETSEFPFWGLIICVDFDLRDLIKMVRYKGLNKIIFQNKNIDIYKTG